MAKQKPTTQPATQPLRVALYLRCSDKKQDTSVKDQRTECTAYAGRKNLKVVCEYADDGISGDATEKRTEFLAMRDDVESGEFSRGEFDAVLCWSQDRFGRFDAFDLGYWIYPFRQAGVRLITTDGGTFDFRDATTRLMFVLTQEQKHGVLPDRSRDVLRGQSKAAADGSWLGDIPFGYRLTGERKNRKLVLGDARERKIVERIFREYVEEERTLSDIARRLNAGGYKTKKGNRWRYDGVKTILANPVYAGTYVWNRNSQSKYYHYQNGEITKGGKWGRNDEKDWIVIPKHHEAIVSQRVFDKAQARLAKGKKGRGRYTPEANPYLLSGKLVCGRCGGPMYGIKGKRYICGRQDYDGGCEGTSVREDVILEYLVFSIQSQILGDEEEDRLRALAKHRRLKASDLPKAFGQLKRLMVGKDRPKTNRKQLEKELKREQTKLNSMLENLGQHLVSRKRIPQQSIDKANAEIADQQATVNELKASLASQPTEQDINDIVLGVLSRLWRLCSTDKGDLKSVLSELDSITVFTTITGEGHGLRHTLRRGEVRFTGFRPIGTRAAGIKPKNRVLVNTSEANLHFLVQSQMACR